MHDFQQMLDRNVEAATTAARELREGGWDDTAQGIEDDLKRFEDTTSATLGLVAVMSQSTANRATHMARMLKRSK